jgi:hypothetical protein
MVALLLLVAVALLAAGCVGNFWNVNNTDNASSISVTSAATVTTQSVTNSSKLHYADIVDFQAYRNNQTYLRKVSDELLILTDPNYPKTVTPPEEMRSLMMRQGVLIPAGVAVTRFGINNTTNGPAGDYVHVNINLKRTASIHCIDHLITGVSYYENSRIIAWIDLNNLNTLAEKEEVGSIRTITPVDHK